MSDLDVSTEVILFSNSALKFCDFFLKWCSERITADDRTNTILKQIIINGKHLMNVFQQRKDTNINIHSFCEMTYLVS